MIVVDSSAIVYALVGARVNPELLAVLTDEQLCAPHLLDFEVASAVRGRVLSGKLTVDRGKQALGNYAGLQILRYEGLGLLGGIWGRRDNFTAYDAAYVVLANILKAPLVTSDAKLLEARRFGVDVQVYQAP